MTDVMAPNIVLFNDTYSPEDYCEFRKISVENQLLKEVTKVSQRNKWFLILVIFYPFLMLIYYNYDPKHEVTAFVIQVMYYFVSAFLVGWALNLLYWLNVL